MGKYITIQLPEKFVINMIDSLVNNENLGYSSRSEVVKDAVRILFTKYPNNFNEIPDNHQLTNSQDIKNENNNCYVILSELFTKSNPKIHISYPTDPISEIKSILNNTWSLNSEDSFFFHQSENICSYNFTIEIKEPPSNIKQKKIILSIIFPEKLASDITQKTVLKCKEFISVLIENKWTFQVFESNNDKKQKQNEHFTMIVYWIKGLYEEIFGSE